MVETMTAADLFWAALEAEGVEVVFGHPGGAILPIYDAHHRRGGRPRHVLVRHEQGAAHAADGYARATGRVGVCIATSGPGATNLVTGLATALMDSVPLVAVTGQVPTSAQGTDAFQETDILGVTMAVTKHGYLVEDPAAIGDVVREAFELARSGRPGPVLIDVPKDVQVGQAYGLAGRNPGSGPGAGSGTAETGGPDAAGGTETTGRAAAGGAGTGGGAAVGRVGATPRVGAGAAAGEAVRAIGEAVRVVERAERPVVMAGRGIVLSGTRGVLVELVERAELPVVTTLLGLDGFPAEHRLALGLPGMHGTERANRAIQEADVILGLGLRFDDRVTGPKETFAPDATIIHADIAPASIGKRVKPAIRVVGDLRETLPALAAGIGPAARPGWIERVLGWAREIEPDEPWRADPSGPPSGRHAARAIARRVRRTGAVVATDVGQHQMWLAQELLDAEPGTHLTSGGLGTMGYALPAALGAAVGRPGSPTWVVAGDGGFQMTLQELATVVDERVPLRIAVMNNGFLGMVRQWQELFYDRRYAATALTGPDLVRLGEAYGVPASMVERTDELDAALDWADAQPGPALLDLRIRREENVFPMVPPGAAIDELVASAGPEAPA